MRITLHSVTAIVLLAAVPLSATADEEPESNRRNESYYNEAEAREKVFGEATMWRDTILVVDSAARLALYEATGLSESDTLVKLTYTVQEDSAPQAVYRVASEMGKHHPFEFLVGLNREFSVKQVVVMNYREARGGDVRRGRFLRQFKDKELADPVSVNRDIVGISGATLSSRAVARGVRKAIWWAHRVWPTQKGVSR